MYPVLEVDELTARSEAVHPELPPDTVDFRLESLRLEN